MGMNTGILFGEVECGDIDVEGGVRGAPDVEVTIDWLKSVSNEEIQIEIANGDSSNSKTVSAITDGNGRYIVQFLWHGVDLPKTLEGRMKMRAYAVSLNDSDRKTVPAVLCWDMKKFITQCVPLFSEPTKDSLNSYLKFMGKFRDHPEYTNLARATKVMLSTELYGIFAEANFYVSQTPKEKGILESIFG